MSRSAGSDFERGRRLSFSRGVRSTLVRGYLIATTVLFFGAGVLAFIVTLGSDDSIAGRIISGAVTVGLFYFGVRRLCLLRVD